MRFLLLFLVAVLASGGVVLAQADPLEMTPLVSGDQFTEMQAALVEKFAPVIVGVLGGLLAVAGVWVAFRRLHDAYAREDGFSSASEWREWRSSGMSRAEWEASKVPSGFVGGGAGWGAPSASDREDYERAMRERDDF